MVFTVSLQIVSRWWGLSNNWTEELTRFLFMGTTFFGLAAGMRTAAHPRVAYFVTHGPAWLRTFSVHLYALCSVVLFGVLVVMSSRLVLQQVASGESSPSLGLRMFIVTLPFVIGAALSIIATIQSIYRDPELKARVERGEIIA
jgi:TRAP-type C4-dicarboxylate transport system permease small subunit